MFKKDLRILPYCKKITGHLKSIDFWTIVGSIATVVGLLFAVLTYTSQNDFNSKVNNSGLNIETSASIDTSQQSSVTKIKKNKLTIGVVNAVGKEGYIKCYTPFVKYISEKLNFDDYELRVLDYKQISGELLRNKIDVGVFSPYSYYDAKRIHKNIELFAVPITHGDLGYRSIIAVKRNSKIKSLKDIKDSKFAYTHPNSTSGYHIPSKLLGDSLGPKNAVFSGTHRNSILWLANDKVDAIATYLEAFIEQEDTLESLGYKPSDFVFINKSKLIPNNALVFSPKLDTLLQEKIKTIMYNAHKDQLANAMFKCDLGINGWVKKDDSFYNDLRYLLDDNRLKYKCKFEINTSENLSNYFNEKNSDIIPYLLKQTRYSLKSTNVFWDENKGNSYCGTYNVVLHLYKLEKTFKYKLELNNRIIAENSIYENKLADILPDEIVFNVLNSINLKAKLKFNPREESMYWFIEYGSENGINTSSFDFVLDSGVVISSEDFEQGSLMNKLIKFPKKYENIYKENMEILIKFKSKSL